MQEFKRSGAIRRLLLCAVSGVILGAAAPALAQQLPAPAADRQSFDAAYFKTYNPVTAADMVARVPGFELRDGDDRRGFGATAGNILINGERPSSKTIPSEQLKRIPADAVIRLELIAGGGGAEAGGQSQLVNIVLRKATSKDSPTTYVLGTRYLQYSERLGYTFQVSRALPLGPNAELALDLQAPNLLGRGESYDILYNNLGVQTGTRIVNGQPNNMGVTGSAVLKWRPGPADSVNLNLQYAPTWNSTATDSTDYSNTGVITSSLRGGSNYYGNYTAELGGDWEHRFSPSFSTKLIGLATSSAVDQVDTFDTFRAPATTAVRVQTRATKSGERVGRGIATWRASPAHTIEFGGEGAFNFRDTKLRIVTTPTGGAPIVEPLTVANARVEEVRGEVFLTDIWTASSALTIESGFTFEASKITQTGDQFKERSFSYPKPRVTATWVLDPASQVRASLQRDVSQLDFGEFSSTVDFVNASSTVGNPDLKPEQAWKARVEWQRRFGKRGALTVAGFYDRVEDVHDLVDISGQDAYGNIGDGTRKGIEIKAAAPLAFVGLPTAEIRFNGLVQQTEVTDPKTLTTRSFSVSPERQNSPPGSATLNAGNKDWAYVINFRQELPKAKSAWGAALVQWSGRAEYKRVETIEYKREGPRLDLFVETTALGPFTVRFTASNILAPDETRVRTFYTPDRASAAVSKSEYRNAQGGPEGTRSFGVQVSGKF